MARIVVFEDEEALRLLLVDVLSEEGHDVVSASTGMASGDASVVGAADLILTDLMMPDCDGLEVIANVRALNRGARIIAMSGGGRTVTTSFLPMARELGADRVLDKPFLPDTLIAEVRDLLG